MRVVTIIWMGASRRGRLGGGGRGASWRFTPPRRCSIGLYPPRHPTNPALKPPPVKAYSTTRSLPERRAEGVMVVRGLLREFYAGTELARIDMLTLEMLGPADSPDFRSRAMEARHLTPFVLVQLQTHADLLGDRGRKLARSGAALVRFREILDSHPRVLPEPARHGLNRTTPSCPRPSHDLPQPPCLPPLSPTIGLALEAKMPAPPIPPIPNWLRGWLERAGGEVEWGTGGGGGGSGGRVVTFGRMCTASRLPVRSHSGHHPKPI